MPGRRPLSMAPAVATHFRHCDVLILNSSAAQVLPNGSARPGVDHARVGLLVGLLLGDQLLFVRHGVISAPPNSRREPQNASTRASHTHTDDDWLAKLNIAIPPSPRWALGGYASFVTLPVANQLRHEGRPYRHRTSGIEIRLASADQLNTAHTTHRPETRPETPDRSPDSPPRPPDAHLQ